MTRAFYAIFAGSGLLIGAMAMGEFGILFIGIVIAIAIAYTAPTETTKSAIYMLDGQLVNEKLYPFQNTK